MNNPLNESLGEYLLELKKRIKKNIKILSINKGSVTIGTKKGFWSKGLEFGNKRRFKKGDNDGHTKK